MTIELTPEDAQLIQKRLETGAFSGVEEVIHDALATQEAEAEWMAQNQEAINQKIARGLEQLDRGEGIPGDVARAQLQQRKAEWLRNKGA